MSTYLTTDGLKFFFYFRRPPPRPEARGICHICHMVNPALDANDISRTSFIWMFYGCFFGFHVRCRMHGEAPVQVPADIPLYPSSIRLWWQQWLRWLVRWTLLRLLAIFCLIIRYDKKGKGSPPYSITERRVPELIPALGSQPAGDVSHKPGVRLPLGLLSARPAVTPATLKRAATNFAAWWTEARWVWTVCPRLLRESVAAAIWTQALLRLSPAR